MKKSGFTLIELLAVIVILAIIALIVTPIVLNTIETAQKGVAQRSYENIKKAANLYFYSKQLESNISKLEFKCENGICSNGTDTLEFEGNGPQDGLIIISEDGTISMHSIVINGYLCKEETNTINCSRAKKYTEKNETGTSIALDNITNGVVSDYKIYGNSAEGSQGVGDLVEDTKDSNYGKYKIPVKVNGKNLIPYPYHDTTKTYKGVTYTDNGDGSITANGTSTAPFQSQFLFVDLTKPITLKAGNYVFKANASDYSNTKVSFWARTGNTTYRDKGNGVAINLTEDADLYFYFVVSPDTTVNNLVVRPQFEKGTAATPYQSYQTSITNIYLDEPLRCVGEVCDYIDFINQQVVRNVEVYEGQLRVLITQKYEQINLPALNLIEEYNEISVDTQTKPTKLEISYYD